MLIQKVALPLAAGYWMTGWPDMQSLYQISQYLAGKQNSNGL